MTPPPERQQFSLNFLTTFLVVSRPFYLSLFAVTPLLYAAIFYKTFHYQWGPFTP